eukprot:TRINITY_DN1000_c0_g1_i3.p1 TRINITY_DN1000_c0_g1~~TRINITY_DN1000_c0_g1_i3.p1  ORF type:complete len:351 (-),score=126.75 TRINITY_DN1000_c0_g1_i3:22-1074(-)
MNFQFPTYPRSSTSFAFTNPLSSTSGGGAVDSKVSEQISTLYDTIEKQRKELSEIKQFLNSRFPSEFGSLNSSSDIPRSDNLFSLETADKGWQEERPAKKAKVAAEPAPFSWGSAPAASNRKKLDSSSSDSSSSDSAKEVKEDKPKAFSFNGKEKDKEKAFSFNGKEKVKEKAFSFKGKEEEVSEEEEESEEEEKKEKKKRTPSFGEEEEEADDPSGDSEGEEKVPDESHILAEDDEYHEKEEDDDDEDVEEKKPKAFPKKAAKFEEDEDEEGGLDIDDEESETPKKKGFPKPTKVKKMTGYQLYLAEQIPILKPKFRTMPNTRREIRKNWLALPKFQKKSYTMKAKSQK